MPARDEKLIAGIERKIDHLAGHELTVIKSRVLTLFDYHVQKIAGSSVGDFSKRVAADEETLGEQAVRDFLDAIDADVLAWSDESRTELRDLLSIVAEERSTTSLDSLSAFLGDADMASMVTQANKKAVAWAQHHVGNMITEVSDTTRNAINEMTATAIDAGWSNRELADLLNDAWEFGPERSMLIARTEPTFAETAGTLNGYRASGVVEGKGWSGEDPCDECQGNVDDGIIGLEDDFSSGDDGPPAHPRCKCSVYAAVLEPDEATV